VQKIYIWLFNTFFMPKIEKKYAILLGAILVLLVAVGVYLSFSASNVTKKTEIPNVENFSQISNYLGKEIYVKGCLSFTCPTIIGAKYPEDCKIALCPAKNSHSCITLQTSSEIRQKLNSYYNESFEKCVETEALGKVIGKVCEPPCVSTYDLEVIKLIKP